MVTADDAAVLVPVAVNGACVAAFGAGPAGACGAIVDGAAAVVGAAGVLVDAADALVDGAGVPLLGVAAESAGLFSLMAALLAADSFAVGAGTAAGSRLSFSTPIVIRPAIAKATHPHGNVLDSRSLGGSISAATSRRNGDGAADDAVIASGDFTTIGAIDVFDSGASAVDAVDDTSAAGGASATAVSGAAASALAASDFGASCAIASDTSAAGGSRAGSATPR